MTDHPQTLSPDDPRLTAYLLGEMEADDLAAFEAELQTHPELLSHLEELRETSALLQGVLEQEPAPALSPAQRFTILSAAANAQSRTSQEKPVMKHPNAKGTWAIIVAVAALSIVLAVIFNRPNNLSNDKDLVAKKAPASKAPGNAEYFADADKEFAQSRFGEIHPVDALEALDDSQSIVSNSESNPKPHASSMILRRHGAWNEAEKLAQQQDYGTGLASSGPETNPEPALVLAPKPTRPASTPTPGSLVRGKSRLGDLTAESTPAPEPLVKGLDLRNKPSL